MACKNCQKIYATRECRSKLRTVEFDGVGKEVSLTLIGKITAAWCDKLGAKVRFIGKTVLFDAPVGSKVFVDLIEG